MNQRMPSIIPVLVIIFGITCSSGCKPANSDSVLSGLVKDDVLTGENDSPPGNHAPTISSKSPGVGNTTETAREAGTSYSITATDQDGDALSYQWKWDGANIAGAASASFNWSTPRNDGYVGEHTLSCVVNDIHGADTTASWTVDVSAGPAKWLVMLYSEGDSNLNNNLIANLVMVEQVPFSYDVRIAFEANSTEHNTLRSINTPAGWPETDLGSNIDGSQGNAIASFTQWAVTHTQADKYVLVLINHGGQFRGLLQDDSAGGLMALPTLVTALDQVVTSLGQPLEVLGFEMCLMAGLEVADANLEGWVGQVGSGSPDGEERACGGVTFLDSKEAGFRTARVRRGRKSSLTLGSAPPIPGGLPPPRGYNLVRWALYFAYPPAQDEVKSRFTAYDVVVDSGASSLAAYQVEITAGPESKIVGVEGGEKPYADAPYYDPAALQGGRIVLAAFTTEPGAPTGKVRVARVHFQETGAAKYSARVVAAAAAGGDRIEAQVALVQTGGK